MKILSNLRNVTNYALQKLSVCVGQHVKGFTRLGQQIFQFFWFAKLSAMIKEERVFPSFERKVWLLLKKFEHR